MSLPKPKQRGQKERHLWGLDIEHARKREELIAFNKLHAEFIAKGLVANVQEDKNDVQGNEDLFDDDYMDGLNL